METITTIWQNMLNLFKPNKERLRKEAQARALEMFNIIEDENGHTFILYGHVKVSPESSSDCTDSLLEDLHELRRMYVEQYIENEGRI